MTGAILNSTVETDVSQEISWQYELLARKAIKSLERNNVPAEFVPNRKDALARVAEIIPSQATVGIGDSVTLHQIGLFPWLEEQKLEVFNAFERHSDGKPVVTGSERFQLMRKSMLTDVYITGTNALTLDGKLVNIDGRGNRVAPMIFGPGQILVIAGANKIVKNEEEALDRIRRIAAPRNGNRHVQKHRYDLHYDNFTELPCMITGTCGVCHSKAKMCRKITVIDGQSPAHMLPGELGLRIIIVGENLGL